MRNHSFVLNQFRYQMIPYYAYPLKSVSTFKFFELLNYTKKKIIKKLLKTVLIFYTRLYCSTHIDLIVIMSKEIFIKKKNVGFKLKYAQHHILIAVYRSLYKLVQLYKLVEIASKRVFVTFYYYTK